MNLSRESELLRAIYQGLPSSMARRFDELCAKRRCETLTPEEHTELLGLSDDVEKREARRLEALIALADIRHLPLTVLMEQLGLATLSDG
jgi:hypothetical protein